jgi:hypothetical protein
MEQRCSIKDLRAICPQYERWTVDENGNPVSLSDEGSSDGDVEEYVCDNCDSYFSPDGNSGAAMRRAWEQAKQHLEQSKQGIR